VHRAVGSAPILRASTGRQRHQHRAPSGLTRVSLALG
jgi:hypothetical protein